MAAPHRNASPRDVIPGLTGELDAIGAKHEGEPDFEARDWRYSEEDIELYGDDFARLEMLDEL